MPDTVTVWFSTHWCQSPATWPRRDGTIEPRHRHMARLSADGECHKSQKAAGQPPTPEEMQEEGQDVLGLARLVRTVQLDANDL